ncbi:MAG: hypothetical protein ABFD54_14750 [Armatimonadota bacterium]|nr:hypothetical protein [bacterium]
MYPKTRRDSSGNGIPVYVDTPCGRKCIGYVVTEGGHRILQKARVSEERHFCKKHRGWGLELSVVQQAHDLGVDAVRIITDDTRITEEAPLGAYEQYGKVDNLGGFGSQIFLPRKYFTRLDSEQGLLFGPSDWGGA